MAKKTKKVVPTKEEIQRRNMINEYNRNNTTTKILLRNVKDEDIKSLEDELKVMQEKHSNRMYLVADIDNSFRVYEFLKDWNANRFLWSQDIWKGVIKFDEYLTEWYEKYQNEKCSLEFDFAAMSYAYNMMMNPYGMGIESAQYMKSVAEQYDAILETLKTYVSEFQTDNEKFKLMQDCLAARYQGFMMVINDETNTEVVQDECVVEVENTDDCEVTHENVNNN